MIPTRYATKSKSNGRRSMPEYLATIPEWDEGAFMMRDSEGDIESALRGRIARIRNRGQIPQSGNWELGVLKAGFERRLWTVQLEGGSSQLCCECLRVYLDPTYSCTVDNSCQRVEGLV